MTEPRAMTVEEMRAELINHLIGIYQYWANIEKPYQHGNQTVERARMEGMLFSIFVLLDGGSGLMPAFDLVPSPHEDDEEYRRSQGENWWAATPILSDVSLHDSFPWERLR